MKSRLNTEWTTRDVERMRALAGAGCSARFAASKLGRTRGSVAFKAMNEGIRFQSIAQPRGVQKRIARRRAR
jgi:hypothetical protein